jgi:hypothetical protein
MENLLGYHPGLAGKTTGTRGVAHGKAYFFFAAGFFAAAFLAGAAAFLAAGFLAAVAI